MGKETPRQQWLKALVARFDNGNLTDFATRVKMDYTGLNLMRSGKRVISEKTVIRLSNRLQVDPPADLKVQGIAKEAPGSKSTPHEEQLAEMVEQLLSVVSRLSDRLDLQTNLINSLCDAVRSNGKDLQALREALVEAKPEHR